MNPIFLTAFPITPKHRLLTQKKEKLKFGMERQNNPEQYSPTDHYYRLLPEQYSPTDPHYRFPHISPFSNPLLLEVAELRYMNSFIPSNQSGNYLASEVPSTTSKVSNNANKPTKIHKKKSIDLLKEAFNEVSNKVAPYNRSHIDIFQDIVELNETKRIDSGRTPDSMSKNRVSKILASWGFKRYK